MPSPRSVASPTATPHRPRRRGLRRLAAALLVATAAMTSVAAAEEITVFAAASLKNALDEIAASWAAASGNTAAISYAGTSTLATQIQQGAPADVFFAASVDWMEALVARGDVDTTTRLDLLGNAIVLIAHGTDAAPVEIVPGFDLAGLLGDEKLAMALVDSVPAGVYGKEALTNLGVWDAVAANVAQSDNVRAALALVATGEAPYGIVYATDAAAEPGVTVVGTFPPESHVAIVYPVAVTTESAHAAAARAFLEYLRGDAARAAFEKQGFTVLVD